MAEKPTEVITNKRVIALFGVPVIEICEVEPVEVDAASRVGDSFDGRKFLNFLGPFVILLAAIVLYWCISSPTNVGSCVEEPQLEDVRRSLTQCESKEKKTNSALENSSKKITKINEEIERYLVEKANLERDGDEARKLASDLKGQLSTVQHKAAKDEQEAKEQLSKVVDEKEVIDKKFNSVEIMLGTCRNKDMKYQISNAKLLEELEEVKKKLDKC